MTHQLSEMLCHPEPAVRRQGIELAESLASQPRFHPQLRRALKGAGAFPAGVIAALMLRLPRELVAVAPGRALFLALPFNLPELPLLARRPGPGVHIVERSGREALPPIRFPEHLSSLSLYYLQSPVLLDAVVISDLPSLTELSLEHLADGVDLSGLGYLSTLRALTVRSAPRCTLEVVPSGLDSLRVERIRLGAEVLRSATGLTELSVSDCAVAGRLELPSPGALRRLQLKGMALTGMPAGVMVQPDLQSLSLKGNEIAALPSSIWTLVGLDDLDLSGNRIAALPGTIGQLSGLRRLDLSSNRIETLPDEIASLTALRSLRLRDNPLTALPEPVRALTRLRSLSLGHTAITEIPESLSALPSLTELELRGLRLRRFPPPNALPALRRVRVDRALEGAAKQWSRQRTAIGLPPLLVH